MKRVYVNEEWCLGCHLCEYYCAFANSGMSDMALALKGKPIYPRIHIEGKIAYGMARDIVLPQLLEAYAEALKANEMAKAQGFAPVASRARELGEKYAALEGAIARMGKALGEKHERILEAMAALRTVVDEVEGIVPDGKWPLPKYREMLFVY